MNIYDRLENLAAGKKIEYIPENPNLKYVFKKDEDFSAEHDDLYGGEYKVNNFVNVDVYYKGEKIGYTASMDLDQNELDLEADDLGKAFFYKSEYSDEFESNIPKGIMQANLENEFFKYEKLEAFVYLNNYVRYNVKLNMDGFDVAMEIRKNTGLRDENGKHLTAFVSTDIEKKHCENLHEVVEFINEEKILGEREHDHDVKPKKSNSDSKEKALEIKREAEEHDVELDECDTTLGEYDMESER